MGFEQSIGFVVAMLVMSVGLLGSVLPGLPGAPIILVAAVGHRLYFGETSVSNLVLVLLFLLTLSSVLLDYLASLLGARTLGATWKGLLGAIVGAIVGFFFGPPGLVLGPFVGAVSFEMLGGREFPEAARAGAGAIVGMLVGAAGKLACCVAMVALFAANVIARSGIT